MPLGLGIPQAAVIFTLLFAGAAWCVVLGGLAAVRHAAWHSVHTTILDWPTYNVGFGWFVWAWQEYSLLKDSGSTLADGIRKQAHNGLITAFAGFLSLSVANTILLFAVALYDGHEAETYGSKGSGASKPTGMAAAGAAPAYQGNTDV